MFSNKNTTLGTAVVASSRSGSPSKLRKPRERSKSHAEMPQQSNSNDVVMEDISPGPTRSATLPCNDDTFYSQTTVTVSATSIKRGAKSADPSKTPAKNRPEMVTRSSDGELSVRKQLERENNDLQISVKETSQKLAESQRLEMILKDEINELQANRKLAEGTNSTYRSIVSRIQEVLHKDKSRSTALNRTVVQHVADLVTEVLECRKDIDRLYDERDKMDKRVQVLNHSITVEKDNVNRANVYLAQQKDITRQRESANVGLLGELKDLRRQLAAGSDAMKQSQIENQKLSEHIDQQEQTVTRAQNAAMTVLSRSLAASLPDDRIRVEFADLFEKIAEWARDNAAHLTEADLTNPENIERWEKNMILRRFTTMQVDHEVDFDLRGDTAVDTLLNASLTRRVCKVFLKNPFWFAEVTNPIAAKAKSQDDGLENNVALQRLWRQSLNVHSGNEGDVHAWRASTVRILTSPEKARRRISTYYRQCVDEQILPNCEDFLDKPLGVNAYEELLAIVSAFGNFAIDLWSQKTHIKYEGLKQFEGRSYTADNKDMNISRAVGVEEEDTGLDGRPIPVVVQPLILGYGSHDGREYDRSRIWSRAIVWVNKDAKPSVRSDKKYRMTGKFW